MRGLLLVPGPLRLVQLRAVRGWSPPGLSSLWLGAWGTSPPGLNMGNFPTSLTYARTGTGPQQHTQRQGAAHCGFTSWAVQLFKGLAWMCHHLSPCLLVCHACSNEELLTEACDLLSAPVGAESKELRARSCFKGASKVAQRCLMVWPAARAHLRHHRSACYRIENHITF